MKLGLNLGSGQRRFETVRGELQWVNVDIVSRPPDQVPDIVCDVSDMSRYFRSDSVDYAVMHQTAEHWGCGEGPFPECYRVLKPGGSLLIFVPDIRALAQRWLAGGISDFIYIVNLMGAYQGLETDRHRWHFTPESLSKELFDRSPWKEVKMFDWREIPGSSLAKDWWVLAVEAVK